MIVKQTPVQIQNWYLAHSAEMDMPEAFLGTEANVYREDRQGKFHKVWDEAKLRVLWAALWTYTDFSGNQTLPLLYQHVNEVPEYLAERSHFPTTHKDLGVFTKHGIPMFGVESRHPMGDFDVIGFSLGYPPYLANAVKQLKMSGIPVRWKDRETMKEPYPLIIAGGSLYGSPEVWTPMVDLVWIGESEDEPGNPGLMAVFKDIARAKEKPAYYTQNGREAFLHYLAKKYNFIYVPRFINPVYDKNKDITGFTYKYDDIPKRVKRRYVRDLDAVTCCTATPIPMNDPSMGPGEIELSRGCAAGNCIFCAVGFRYRPYRERSIEYMLANMKENIKNTGATAAFPTAFEFTGYTQKKLLTKRMLEEVSDSLDSQSQRIDSMARDPNFVLLAGEGGMEQLAVGVEGNSERLRTYVNKGATEELIIQACTNAIKAGFKKLKLYLIANLPPETQEDTDSILALVQKLADIRDSVGATTQIRCSWTPLLIEAWTPLQWDAPTLEKRSLYEIHNALQEMGADFTLGKKTEQNYAWSTQICHMCDRIAAEALINCYDNLDATYVGAVNRSMKEQLEIELKRLGIKDGYAHYFRAKPKDYIFPWDIIDIGVTKEYMWMLKEHAESFIAKTEADSKFDKRNEKKDGFIASKCMNSCLDCGACDLDQKKANSKLWKQIKDDEQVDLSKLRILDEKSVVQKIRLKIVKDPYYRYPTNDYWRHVIRRAAYIGEIPITKRSVRFSTDEVKFKNWVTGVDYVEFGLLRKAVSNKADMQALIATMNKELVYLGVEVVDGDYLPPKIDSLRRHGEYSLYEITTDRTLAEVKQRLENWHKAESVKMVLREDGYRSGMVREEVNAKDMVADIWAIKEGSTLKIRAMVKGKASPFNVYCALFACNAPEAYKQPASKVEAFVFEDSSVQDFFRPVCGECGTSIPTNFLGKPLDSELCPHCKDKLEGREL